MMKLLFEEGQNYDLQKAFVLDEEKMEMREFGIDFLGKKKARGYFNVECS